VRLECVVGTQFYEGNPDAARRQQRAAASMRALRGAEIVNLQWRDEVCACPGIETLAVLTRDSRPVSGSAGPRKPIVCDLLDALAAAAERRRLRYFCFVNSDVIVRQSAVDTIVGRGKQTYAFSRMDFDGETGLDVGIVTRGLDAFAMDAGWWRAERRRFRPYILGEWFYDCVFGAIMMTFGDGLIENHEGQIRHQRHAQSAPAATTPSVRYNGYLVALDARLFSLWAQYHGHLEEYRARGASAAEEGALIRQDFVWRPSPIAALWHAGRCAKARWRYARDRAKESV
jgi:hypothetical protein